MSSTNPQNRDRVYFKLFLKPSMATVTDEEVQYFRDHPDEIDEVTAPVNIHKMFLWIGALLGAGFVAVSKVLKGWDVLAALPEGVNEFIIDVIFEAGVALIGAAVTAYFLGILLNYQQENAAKWRAEIRRRIREQE